MKYNVIILAAGKGSRMKSQLPKVLQPLAGKPLLHHVVKTAKTFSEHLYVVIGHGAEKVKERFASDDAIKWVIQEQQLGTGHAVQQVLPYLQDGETTLILYGDVPLIKPHTLEQLLGKVGEQAMALLTVELEQPQGYGRILRDNNKAIKAIVEEKDASVEQRLIREVNTGIIAIRSTLLKKILPQLQSNNAQGEYYLTDIISLAVTNGVSVDCVCTSDEIEVQGVNDKKQLAFLERAYQQRLAMQLMEQGVTLADPARIDIRGEITVGQDVFIDVNCIFEGQVRLGNNVTIGPNCVIGESGKTVQIANNVEIKANSIIEEAIIDDDCVIGPYARLRPGTRLAKHAKIGNFVETKKADIGEGSKVNHLTYIGDAVIGKDVNIGAGTITCNYDGVNKYQTIIKDNAFIGSNTSLVAPVTVGESATVGAGSTINRDIDKDDLAIARSKQKNIQGWQRPKKK